MCFVSVRRSVCSTPIPRVSSPACVGFIESRGCVRRRGYRRVPDKSSEASIAVASHFSYTDNARPITVENATIDRETNLFPFSGRVIQGWNDVFGEPSALLVCRSVHVIFPPPGFDVRRVIAMRS